MSLFLSSHTRLTRFMRVCADVNPAFHAGALQEALLTGSLPSRCPPRSAIREQFLVLVPRVFLKGPSPDVVSLISTRKKKYTTTFVVQSTQK